MSTQTAEAAYIEHKSLIEQIARSFAMSCHSNLDDCLSVCDEAFMQAWHGYDRKRPFKPYLTATLRNSLIAFVREEKKQPTISIDGLNIPAPARPMDWLARLLAGVSPDARYAIKLAIDTPKELMDMALAKGGNPINIRSSIWQVCRAAGWNSVRVRYALHEIRRAIQRTI